MLAEYQFIRPSKSALINTEAIERIDFKSQKNIRLVNGDIICISRRNVRPLREQFKS
jgi:DNA-binding LytR/AlgR family response regulator